MSLYLGIDTSNYTTSTALYDSETGQMRQCKRLLPVQEGQLRPYYLNKGLRYGSVCSL